MNMTEFAIAYEAVSSLSQEEAKEKLALLRRCLPLEKEVPKDFFEKLFSSTFRIPERDLSLIKDRGTLFIHLYNLTLRKAKGEELIEDNDKEYALYQQYRDLLRRFPHVNIDDYNEEVVKLFARRHREMVKELAEKYGVVEKTDRCRAKPRLGAGRNENYLTVRCYTKAKKDRALFQGNRDYILPLYALAVAYWYARGEK